MSIQFVESSEQRQAAEAFLGPIQARVEKAKKERSRYEPVWHENRAFAAGKFWHRWSRSGRQLKLDPRDIQHAQRRVSVDILTQNLMTALGQLAGSEQRRNLMFRREDVPSEDFTEAANAALKYGWEHEWDGKRKLDAVKRKLIVDGTAAVECYFDPTKGAEIGEMPVRDGQPIYDGPEAREYVAETAERGEQADYKLVNEGRICWHPLSAFQILVPPGIEDDELFPWEATVQAVHIDRLIDRYGEAARGLKAEPLAVLEAMGLKDSIEFGFDAEPEEPAMGRPQLDDHVVLVTFRERPCPNYPRGRVVWYAGNRLLDVADELPYKRPNGDYHSGLVYFRYWRVEGRFWGRGLIEPGKGIQRTYNKRHRQEGTTIDRGQPYILASKLSKLKKTEEPLEVVEWEQGAGPPPQGVHGIPVHDSIWRSKDGLLADMERALGIHAVSTGEAPTRETTYAELQLRAEKDRTKLDPIFEDFQGGVAVLTELSVWDIKRYWTQQKIVAIAGEEGYAEAVAFQANKLPEFFLTELSENAKPRTGAADIQLVMDLWRADKEYAGLTGRPPQLDIDWLKASLDAGKPVDFPQLPENVHEEKARWENSLMREGEIPKPLEYDPPDVHIPIHVEDQVEAEMAGDEELWYRIETHKAAHLALAEQLAELAAQEHADAQQNLAASLAEQEGEQAAAEQQAEGDQAEADHQRTMEVEQQRQQQTKES